MGNSITYPRIEQNYNYGNYQRGAGGVTGVNPFAPVDGGVTGGISQGGQLPEVNLESKCGTSNQVATLPGRGTTYVARNLDFLS